MNFQKSDKFMEFDFWLTVFTFIVSFVSACITGYYSHLQRKHNKNSVRPIPIIKFNDYENKIVVKIENVGTGPLIIKELRFKKYSSRFMQEADSLIALMPEINQSWSTFTDSIDRWTIPVGGQLILIKLYPKNRNVGAIVRKELSEITAYLKYADVYNTNFQYKRSFDFFGRHFK